MSPHFATMLDLSAAECVALLSDGGVGVVAFVDDDGPDQLPVTFGVRGDALLFCTEKDGRLAQHAHDRELAFEIHDLEPALRSGWSVVVRGLGQVSDRATEEDRLGQDIAPWAPGHHDAVISLSLERISGRRILPGAGSVTELLLTPIRPT
jgi:nitroimidazol reductase NimA-like FMN-containing flavoprotein (pyridoxamine 5'-phosphate oxidase superfamily)